MKKLFLPLFSYLFFFFLNLFLFKDFSFSQQNNNQEKIKLFSEQIKINKDGTIEVKEIITYDFGFFQKHGIYRNIPFIKKNNEGKNFILEFKNFQVSDEKGNPYRFIKNYEGELIKLKIGDSKKTISGVHTYIITYQVGGALTYFSDHDELYWNVTGNDWNVPIEKAEVLITYPEEISGSEIRIGCYTGFLGSKESECLISSQEKLIGHVLVQTARVLSAGQGLTIIFGFPKGIVAVLEPKEQISFWKTFLRGLISLLILFLILIWYFCLPIYIIFHWLKYGRDPKSDIGVTTAWFDPPKTYDNKRFLTPAEVGTLGDETVDLKDISATIVDLARRGYLKVEERKEKQFWLIKKEKNQDELLSFERTLLEEFFKNSNEVNLQKINLADEVEKIKKSIYKQVVEIKLFPENPERLRKIFWILVFLGLITTNFFLSLVSLIFGLKMPRKTLEGVRAKNIAFSLRNFLKSQERQLEFQADKQMLFERLLPYAIVFGVEKIWAKRFANLDIKQPDWYQRYSIGHFNSQIFVEKLNSSLTSFKSAATLVSSSSGFSSGFSSGGGFSGGGGGGGGSW